VGPLGLAFFGILSLFKASSAVKAARTPQRTPLLFLRPAYFTIAIIGASDDRIDCFNNFFYGRGDKIKIGSRDRPRLTQQIGLKVAFMRYLIPTGNN
jgi:hypothetical protein